MNNISNLMSFDKDGLELVIDMIGGEAFASISAMARMVERNESTIRDFLTSRKFDLKSTEINTQTGLKTSRLLDEIQIYEVCEKYKPSLLKSFAQAGLRVYLHKLAGFEVQSTAIAQNLSDSPMLNQILETVRSIDRRLSGVESTSTASPSHDELPQSILNIIDRRDKKQQAYANLLEIRDQWCKAKGIQEGALGDYSFMVTKPSNGSPPEVRESFGQIDQLNNRLTSISISGKDKGEIFPVLNLVSVS